MAATMATRITRTQGGVQALIGAGAIAAALAWRGPDAGSAFVIGFAGLVFIFLPAERLIALRPQQILRSGWRTDLMHYFVSSAFVGMILSVAAASGALLLATLLGPSALKHAVGQQPGWLQFIEAVVASDLGGYFAHRASHKWSFLWRFHSVHHSIVEMDWLASARFHPVDQAVTHGAAVLPLLALGFSGTTLGGYGVFQAALAIAVHANVRTRIGKLSWLVGNPEFHHWHHATDPEAWNKNFVAALPLIDLVFGTAYLPRGRRPTGYGIQEQIPADYWGQLTHPLRRRTHPISIRTGDDRPHGGAPPVEPGRGTQ